MQKYLNKDNLCALLCLLVVVFTVRSAKAEFPTVFAFPDLSAGTKQEEPPKDTEPPVISASDFETWNSIFVPAEITFIFQQSPTEKLVSEATEFPAGPKTSSLCRDK